ncbi:hypothetical protein DPMN_038777 [Dreissena polymorpha]|uniref:Uncharacterized protein n=1 Tax=Dreissena polymorpha TaxID=45954 RepID=A0A9D4MDS2_DREPO|nr:hypothetical protein DPMN_038777 [Dreissena polymorpha]
MKENEDNATNKDLPYTMNNRNVLTDLYKVVDGVHDRQCDYHVASYMSSVLEVRKCRENLWRNMNRMEIYTKDLPHPFSTLTTWLQPCIDPRQTIWLPPYFGLCTVPGKMLTMWLLPYVAPAIRRYLPGDVDQSTSDHMAPAILQSLPVPHRSPDLPEPQEWRRSCSCGPSPPCTVQDVDHDIVHVASAMRWSTSDHMAPTIRQSMLSDVNHMAFAMRRSMSDHIASTVLRSLPGDITGHVITGPFTGSLVIDRSGLGHGQQSPVFDRSGHWAGCRPHDFSHASVNIRPYGSRHTLVFARYLKDKGVEASGHRSLTGLVQSLGTSPVPSITKYYLETSLTGHIIMPPFEEEGSLVIDRSVTHHRLLPGDVNGHIITS